MLSISLAIVIRPTIIFDCANNSKYFAQIMVCWIHNMHDPNYFQYIDKYVSDIWIRSQNGSFACK
jgi:hypothetical protein